MSEVLVEVKGCGNVRCEVAFPKPDGSGMHTTGGCHCLDNLKSEDRLLVRKAIFARDKEIEALNLMLKLVTEGAGND